MTWAAHTLGASLERIATARGSDEALVTNTCRLDFRALQVESRRVAKALLGIGIQHGDFVGVLMGNDGKWVSAFFGAALIGAVTVPVNTRFKAAELAFCLKQADCKALVFADRFLNIDFVQFVREAEPAVDSELPGTQLPKLARAVVIGPDIPNGALSWDAFLDLGAAVSAAQLAAATDHVKPHDLLLIQFTSGTTAHPKGVMLTHDNMLRNAWAAGLRIGIRPEDRYFNCRPFFHVGGLTLSLLMALEFGACLVTLPTFEAAAALAMMEQERCTLTSGNDTIFQLLMGHADFPHRRLVLRGGWVAATPETVRRIIEVLGATEICVAYGLSEASPNVVMSDYRDPPAVRISGRAKTHPGLAVRIADPVTHTPLPPDTTGEIQVRGWSIMRGYYNNPEANAKAFTADGWLRTGDLGMVDCDARLSMVGRLKDVFRVGGENVAPAEVEDILLHHPAIATAQVVGVPDALLGEVPVAYVTIKAGAQATEAEILAWVKTRAANFRVPRYLRIVQSFDAIGMTASGKVQKVKLREHAIRELGLQ
ncbi:MAG: fatty-acid--CoA ligase [Betaproteobacteria bacterium]|nr:fatty-acid--CoA ligase [Betaproteobacteria bacterium]